jgi:hypothetical protein
MPGMTMRRAAPAEAAPTAVPPQATGRPAALAVDGPRRTPKRAYQLPSAFGGGGACAQRCSWPSNAVQRGHCGLLQPPRQAPAPPWPPLPPQVHGRAHVALAGPANNGSSRSGCVPDVQRLSRLGLCCHIDPCPLALPSCSEVWMRGSFNKSASVPPSS